jgi:hypothetical protein
VDNPLSIAVFFAILKAQLSEKETFKLKIPIQEEGSSTPLRAKIRAPSDDNRISVRLNSLERQSLAVRVNSPIKQGGRVPRRYVQELVQGSNPHRRMPADAQPPSKHTLAGRQGQRSYAGHQATRRSGAADLAAQSYQQQVPPQIESNPRQRNLRSVLITPIIFVLQQSRAFLRKASAPLQYLKVVSPKNFYREHFFPLLGGLLAAIVVVPLISMGVQAATAVVLPNEDVVTDWSQCNGGTCSSDRYTYIDEDVNDSPNTSTHIGTGPTGSSGADVSVEFGLTNVTNVDEATSITVYILAQSATNANGGTLDDIDIDLRIGGSLQGATRVTPQFNTWGVFSATFNGSWSQAQLDGAQVRLTRIVQGSGNPTNQRDDVRVAALSTEVTYTSLVETEQSSYRWFENEDSMAASPANWQEITSSINLDGDGRSATFKSSGDTLVLTNDEGDGFMLVDSSDLNPDNWSEISNSNFSLPGDGRAATFTSDDEVLVLTHLGGFGDFLTLVDSSDPNPANWTTTPNNMTTISAFNTAVFIDSDNKLVMGGDNGIFIYNSSSSDTGDWSSIHNISVGDLGDGTIYQIAFTGDEDTLVGVHSSGDRVTIIDSSDSTPNNWTKISNSNISLSGTGHAATFTDSEDVLVLTHEGGDRVTLVDSSNPDPAEWDVITNSALSLPGTGYAATFTDSEDVLVLTHEGGDRVTLVDSSNPDPAEWDVITNSALSLPGIARDAVFSADSGVLVLAHVGGDGVTFVDALTAAGVGSALASQDSPVVAPAEGTPFRLRATVSADQGDIPAESGNFKLQYAELGPDAVCTSDFSGGEVYQGVPPKYSVEQVTSFSHDGGTIADHMLESSSGDIFWSFSSEETAYIYRSTDGGGSWNEVESVSTGERITTIHLLESGGGDLFWSFGSRDNTAYLYRSTDSGASWSEVESVTTGDSIWTDHLLESGGGDLFWSFGSGDNTAYLYRSTDSGASWSEVESVTTGDSIWTDHLLESGGGDLFWSFGSGDNTAYLYRSTDGGSNWSENETVITDSIETDHLLEANGTLFWSFAGWDDAAYLYKSTDWGDTWSEAKAVEVGTYLITDFLLAGSDGNIYWSFGSNPPDNTAYLYRSTDGGTSWSEMKAAVVGSVNNVHLLEASSGDVFWSIGTAQNSAHLYLSTDQGDTWREIQEISTNDQVWADNYLLESSSGDVFWSTGDVDEVAYLYSATTNPLSYYYNSNIPDGTGIASGSDDPDPGSGSAVLQSYVESNSFTNPDTIPDGDYGVWDFALVDNNAPGEARYCFRIVNSDGSELATYTVIPELSIPPPTFMQGDYRWFEDKELEGEHWPLIETLLESSEQIISTRFSPDGELIAYASNDNVYVHSATDWSHITTISQTDSIIRDFAFSPDSQYLAYAMGHYEDSTPNGIARIYSTDTWNIVDTIADFELFNTLDFSPDGNYMALGVTLFGSGNGNINIYSTSDWTLEEQITSPPAGVFNVEFSPDSNQLIYSSEFFDSIDIRHISTTDWSQTGFVDLSGSGSIRDITYSPGGEYIAYGRVDNSVYIHSTTNWSLLETLSEATGDIRSVDFSGDGELLAYASNDGNVYIHSTDDWSLEETLSEATDSAASVSFSSDDEYIAYGGADNNVYVHSTASLVAEVGTPLADENVPFTLDDPNQAVRLRMLMDVDDKDATAGDFKLQYAPRLGDTCELDFTGYSYQDLGPSTLTNSYGPNAGSAATNDGIMGTVNWSSPENVLNPANSSSASIPETMSTRTLKVTGFGFDIPEQAEIVGIEMQFEIGFGGGVAWHPVAYKNGVLASEGYEPSGTEGSYTTAGGEGFLWGEQWTPSDINDSEFGVGIWAENILAEMSTNVSIVHIRAVVYYSQGSSDDVVFRDISSASTGLNFDPSVDDPTSPRDIVNQVYVQSNNFSIVNETPRGATAMFDFSIYDNSELGGNYCFRIVRADGSLLDNYAYIAELGSPPRQQQLMRHGRWFDTAQQSRPFFW